MSWRTRTVLFAIVASLTCARCGGGGGASTPTSPGNPIPPVTPTPIPVPSGPQIFVGAGDIGLCGSPGAEQTARLLEGIGGTVFTAGDNAYFSGTAQEYRDCYDPSWGRLKSRTFPTPGNHEYATPGGAGYFQYFGAAALGQSGQGYYSFPLGDWHAIALNNMIGVDAASTQADWLRADLATSGAKCTIVYWHYPLFTSGPSTEGSIMRDVWRILYAAGVDVVVNGHDHLYERFALQDPDGRPDPNRGIKEFIAGTGGVNLFYNATKPAANSERVITNTWGVLKFTLQTGSYSWDFVPVSGQSDSGTGTCH